MNEELYIDAEIWFQKGLDTSKASYNWMERLKFVFLDGSKVKKFFKEREKIYRNKNKLCLEFLSTRNQLNKH